MHPELFKIPFTGLTIKSYGLMIVLGFVCAMWVIRRLSRRFTPDPALITNAALYSLIAGVVGARVFYVAHYWEQFSGRPLAAFAIWEGGLELLGGVILAVGVILGYLWRHKLPVRRYLDVLAIGLFVALGFGRIGCFLNGCCFGAPSDVSWAVRFPYGSLAYRSQVYPDPERGRDEAYINLPGDYFETVEQEGAFFKRLKEKEELTAQQRQAVTVGHYRALPVHPTQLYSSAAGFLCAGVLYAFWRRRLKRGRFFGADGMTFAFLFLLYAPIRFGVEFLRDDNPFEFDGLTVSQNIAMGMFVLGLGLMFVFGKMGSSRVCREAGINSQEQSSKV